MVPQPKPSVLPRLRLQPLAVSQQRQSKARHMGKGQGWCRATLDKGDGKARFWRERELCDSRERPAPTDDSEREKKR